MVTEIDKFIRRQDKEWGYFEKLCSFLLVK